jgi:hypothetical protein
MIIPGAFYDSQIYSGYLYLWTTDGGIVTVNWNALLAEFAVENRLRLALRSAFQRSEYLYGEQWRPFFGNEELRSVIAKQFDDLALQPLEVTKEQLNRCSVRETNPFRFPHADTAVYFNHLYVGGTGGIQFGSLDDTFEGQSPDRLWDGGVLQIAAGSSRLAIAAGSDGAWQTHLSPTPSHDVSRILEKNSKFVRWIRINLFSASDIGQSYFAEFKTLRRTPDEMKRDEPLKRMLKKIVPVSDLFDSPETNGRRAIVWGAGDRICMLRDGALEILKYNPSPILGKRFLSLGTVAVDEVSQSEVLGCDSAVFGFVLELANGLLVIDSSLSKWTLNGEPVNWRVFPRSIYYTNQLHLIREDHLEVYSFNHDYFVDQSTKVVGTELRPRLQLRGKND